ncbi:putative ATP-binding protein involved in virulence [Providencia alcalifaciens]|nr:putative ATP-binding protein involved in virulence [Providencia alcalifaciens]
MKIDNITIKNFRCFKELEIDLHPKLTVLTTLNGAGKTTLLDALRICVWPFVKGFDLGSQVGKSATIQIEDVRITQINNSMEPQLVSSITTRGCWDLEDLTGNYVWTQQREQIKPRTNMLSDAQTKKLVKAVKKIQSKIHEGKLAQNGDKINLPLIVYLGTGRLWYQGRYTSEVGNITSDIASQSRLWGYQNCLTATSSYKQFENWFAEVFISYRELQIMELEVKKIDNDLFNHFKNGIKVVQQAINALTKEETGWFDLQYRSSQNKQLVMEHPEHGFIPLSQLSDGLRNMVGMISDIAFRCFKLNPHLGNEAAKKQMGLY